MSHELYFKSFESVQYEKLGLCKLFLCDMQNNNCCEWRQTCRDMSKSTILLIALNVI